MGECQIWRIPVSRHTEAFEILTLYVYIFFCIFTAQLSYIMPAHPLFLGSKLFIYLVFNRKPMAVPSGCVRGIKPLHSLRPYNDIFEDLIQCFADVYVAISIWRSIVEDIFFSILAGFPESLVNICRLPSLKHHLFHLSEVCLHGEVGLREVERVFIILFHIVYDACFSGQS